MNSFCMKTIKLLCILFLPATISAQYTYTETVAPLIYNKCSSCHHQGDIAPFALTNYKEVSEEADMIRTVITKHTMPPWMPDTAYCHFLNERSLTHTEIDQITSWISSGMPKGDAAAEPELPEFPKSSALGKPDLVLSMQHSYLHKGNNADEYRVFVLPTALLQQHDVAAIEIRPGNPAIVHHIILGLDTTRFADKLDAKDPAYGYAQYAGFGFYPTYNNWSGWVPGNKTRFFPDGIGTNVFARSEVLLQMHYGPSPLDAADSTVVNIYYSKKPVKRYLQSQLIGPNEIQDGPFFIPANKTKTFHAEYKVLEDISLISITPHMHWLGRKWEVYAINPRGDTTHLIRINNWDFNWQNFFAFTHLVKIEKGSVIHAAATFDNTTSNEANPNAPPKNIKWGESAKDEMFLVYFASIPYQTGDEKMDGAAAFNSFELIAHSSASGKTELRFTLDGSTTANLKLTDKDGKVIKQFFTAEHFEPGKQVYPLDTHDLKPGAYWCKFTTSSFTASRKLVIP